MGIIESITAPLVLALCGAVGKLWASNNALGKKIDSLSRSLGRMEGLMSAVRVCPVKICPIRQQMADIQESESFSLGKRRHEE